MLSNGSVVLMMVLREEVEMFAGMVGNAKVAVVSQIWLMSPDVRLGKLVVNESVWEMFWNVSEDV